MARTTKTPGDPIKSADPADDEQGVAQPAEVAQDDGLPNDLDVDPSTITGPTLTRQGWIVPGAKG
jgi:hypothetical protein